MTTEQLVTGVDFVPFSTQDLDKAVEFYGETLGLRRSVYMPERQYAEFETGNVTSSIIVGEAMGIGHRVNALAVALHVDDVAAARAALEQRGVEFTRRHPRHGRMPHGVLRRSRRQRADAPPPLRAAGDRGLTSCPADRR